VSDAIRIRPAERTDVAQLMSMIAELAAYERARDRVTGTEELLAAALFGEDPLAEAVIAELDAGGLEPGALAAARPSIGFAVYFASFSTWLCRPGLYLEDLYVRPEYRGRGVGRMLLAHLAALAIDRGCARLEWTALDWNTPAIEFYERLGATPLDQWRGFRLSGPDLAALAQASTGAR